MPASVEAIDLEKVMKQGFTAFLQTYSGLDAEQCAGLLDLFVDFEKLGAQFRYFCDRRYLDSLHDYRKLEKLVEKGLVEDRGQLDEEFMSQTIFREKHFPEIPVHFKPVDGKTRGWTDAGGWQFDGVHHDLGSVNGPFPIQELIKLIYVTTALAMTAGPEAPKSRRKRKLEN